MSGIDIQVDEHGIAQVVMTRLSMRNALSAHQADLIAAATDELGTRPDIRVVILRSADPQFFSVGADLKERQAMDQPQLLAARDKSMAATRGIFELPMPTVAAVSGMALGGGLELALACDVVVADAFATLALPETGIGIIPGGGGTQLLPRRIGFGRTAALIFSGRRLTGTEAYEYGIVDVLAESGALTAALDLAKTMSTKSPTAQRNAKAALRNGQHLPVNEALAVENEYWRASAFSADYQEGLRAFADKRQPSWDTAATSSAMTGEPE